MELSVKLQRIQQIARQALLRRAGNP